MNKELIKEVKRLLVKRFAEEGIKKPSDRKLKDTAIGIISMRELRGSKDYNKPIPECVEGYINFIKSL